MFFNEIIPVEYNFIESTGTLADPLKKHLLDIYENEAGFS